MIYAVIDTNVLVAAAKTQIPGRSFDKLRNRLSNPLRNRLSNLLRNRPGITGGLGICGGIDNFVKQKKEDMMETERILLRPWVEEDAEILYKWAKDPEVGPRAGWPPHKDVEESREIIRKIFSGEGMWAVVLKETGEPIGCVGYLSAGASNLQIAQDEGEVGYWIAKPYWNLGICTEALGLVIDYCFREKGFKMLWGTFFTSNPASGRVMEKCGFIDTGVEVTCPNLEVGSDFPVRVLKLEK